MLKGIQIFLVSVTTLTVLLHGAMSRARSLPAFKGDGASTLQQLLEVEGCFFHPQSEVPSPSPHLE